MASEKQIKNRRKAPRTAWKPGQSGNLKGRKKLGQSLAEILRSTGEAGANALISKAVIEKASQGDIAAAKLYWDRAYGQAPATVDISASIHSATVEELMERTRNWLVEKHPKLVVEYLKYVCQK